MKMKITPEHYNIIKQDMAKTMCKEAYEDAVDRVTKRGKCKNFEDAVMHQFITTYVYKTTGLLYFVCDVVFKYAGGTHLLTAYRKAWRELKKLHGIN